MKVIRASLLHFPKSTSSPDQDFEYYADGLLATDNGKIIELGDFSELEERYQEYEVLDKRDCLLVPGFIDTHLHFPQTEMIASYGEQLLEWLENYTFPTERKFANPEYAELIADKFLHQLWSNGTTTAMVYATVHKCSAEALFKAANAKNMQMITGKVCMDRNSPDWLQDTAQSAYEESAELIDKWHNNNRLKYAITPRFAPTSTAEQLTLLGQLAKEHSDAFIQTHLSENKDEIAWVQSLYPEADHYLDVYDRFGLLSNKAVFGHCIHLDDDSWKRLGSHQAIIAFCPRSNTFLGSGLFDIATAEKHNVPVTLATDVGGGDSFSMLRTLGEAYKICQLQKIKLDPFKGLYMMTQGSAKALELDDQVGNLNQGTDADFVLIKPQFNELTELRLQNSQHKPEDILFALSMLADERAIDSTWIAGEAVYQKENA